MSHNLYFLDYQYHRDHFKETLEIRFTHFNDSLYDSNVARLIFYLWELCQTYSCAMPYNGIFLSDQKYGRNHFVLTDFRLTSKSNNLYFKLCNL